MDLVLTLAIVSTAATVVGAIASVVAVILAWPRKGHGKHRASKRGR